MAVTRRPGPGSRSGEPRRGQNPAYRPSDPVILAHRSSRPRPCPKISQVCVAGAAPDARRRRRTRLEFVDVATDNSYSSPATCPAIGIRATGSNLGEFGLKHLALGVAVLMGLGLAPKIGRGSGRERSW